jgi:hypothetical protein
MVAAQQSTGLVSLARAGEQLGDGDRGDRQRLRAVLGERDSGRPERSESPGGATAAGSAFGGERTPSAGNLDRLSECR